MEIAMARFAAQKGDFELHKQLNSWLQEYKDYLSSAQEDRLCELNERFQIIITEFRLQNRLWKIINIE